MLLLLLLLLLLFVTVVAVVVTVVVAVIVTVVAVVAVVITVAVIVAVAVVTGVVAVVDVVLGCTIGGMHGPLTHIGELGIYQFITGCYVIYVSIFNCVLSTFYHTDCIPILYVICYNIQQQQYQQSFHYHNFHFLCVLFADYPLLGLGLSQTMSTMMVFLFSAIFHEVIISTPFKHFGLHAFLGMLAQAPLINVTKYVDRWLNSPTLGNVVFWCLFCVLGKCACMCMYVYVCVCM